MKKICFFSGNIANGGGTERVAIMIANKLKEIGYDVAFLSFKEGTKTTFKLNSKISLYSLHLENNNTFFGRKIEPYLKLIKFFRKNRFDIIINIDILLCLYTIPLKFFIKSKIIAWEHFNFRNNNGVKNRDKARKIAAKYSDCIIVLTKADYLEYKKRLRIKAKIKKIYNPTIMFKINEKERENVVLASGRLSFSKNMEELIEIWREVEKSQRNWKLVICGSGENKKNIIELIHKYNLKNVKLEGFCNNMNEYYEKAKIFAMTSRYEGFPMVLLEAQSHGIPLISYDCFTGPSEIIINQKNGYLIEYGNKKEFADKLIYMIKNEKILNEFRENAYKDSKRFDIDNIINEWVEIIEKI